MDKSSGKRIPLLEKFEKHFCWNDHPLSDPTAAENILGAISGGPR